jgi:hypothetical protein
MDPDPIWRTLSEGYSRTSWPVARAERARFWPDARLMS